MSNTAAHKGFTLWFTGLPCSGKTSISDRIESELRRLGYPVEHLDGDVIRKELAAHLSFSKEDRAKNIAQVAFIASLLSRNGVITIVSLVSPYREMRDGARQRIPNFIEVFVKCPLAVCEQRDTKGMYRLARAGKIQGFTGVSDPYEEPLQPELILETDRLNLDQCIEKLISFLRSRGHLDPLAFSAVSSPSPKA